MGIFSLKTSNIPIPLKSKNSSRVKEKMEAKTLNIPSGKRKGRKTEEIKGIKDRNIREGLMPSEEIPKYHTGMEAKYPKERHQEIHRGLLGLRRERSKKTKGITARR